MDVPVFTVDQFSAHLRAFRRARGLTQAGLGALIGVKQARIADIEADPGAVSVAQMHQLLTLMGAQLVLRDTQAPAADAPGGPDDTPTAPRRGGSW